MNETSSQFPFGLSSLPEDWGQWALVPSDSVAYCLGIALVTLATCAWIRSSYTLRKLPYVNPPGLFSDVRAKLAYRDSAKRILRDARRQYPNQPYRMTTEFGEVVMLPSESMDEIRNSPSLSFFGTLLQERICEIPGFEPLAAFGLEGELVQIIARKQLTRLLSHVTAPLNEEAAHAISINMGESTEWHEITMMPAVRDIVARMTSRVFLGEELARSEDWLQIAKGYTVDLFKAIDILTRYPVYLRPYIGWLFPECRRVRDYYGRTRKVINPLMKKRADMIQAALAAGQPAPVFNDALEWIVQESKERNASYDVTTFQLIVSTVSINTTTDLVQSVLIDFIQHPEAMQAVRDEMVEKLKEADWKKSAIYNMKLLDSAIKESQRIHPVFLAMRRSVETDMALSDGTVLKKGTRVHIDTHRMIDPEVYENPEEWNASRFLELRSQPGKEHMAQLVSTSVDHFGFGHGNHACPGRFFAANEMKIALCHLLLKYDWEFAPETDTRVSLVGFNQRANPNIRVLCRRRAGVELEIPQ